MADRYVRSTDGSDSDNGTTWPLAKATLAGVAAIDTAGDRLFLSQVHAESTAAAVTTNWAGTVAAPTQIICGNDAAQPPTASATTATATVTGANSFNFAGSVASTFYAYGLTLICGTGSSGNQFIAAGASSVAHRQTYESCNFKLTCTGSTSTINAGGATLINCGFQFADAGQKVQCATAPTIVRGGSVLSGGTSPTTVFNPTSSALQVDAFDFSNCSSGVNLCDGLNSAQCETIFRNCKLPASWSGALVGTPASMAIGSVATMINCSDGSQNYKYWRQNRWGSVRDETTIVLTGGATDGTTPISWKMVSLTTSLYPSSALQSADILVWNAAVGSSVTATIEIVTDGVTLKDNECWLEVEYLGSSGQPLGTIITDRTSSVIGTAANQASSTATWTTTGLSSPVTQKLSVTFTPQMVGFVIGRVLLAKASTTVYVDPKMVIA